MLKLKLQYFGHLMQRADSLEKTLMLGKIQGKRRRGWQRKRWLDDISLSRLWEIVKDRDLVCCSLGARKESDTTEQQLWSLSVKDICCVFFLCMGHTLLCVHSMCTYFVICCWKLDILDWFLTLHLGAWDYLLVCLVTSWTTTVMSLSFAMWSLWLCSSEALALGLCTVTLGH